jgi:IS605 OrfB family transposase
MKTFQIKCKISKDDQNYLKFASIEICKYYNAMVNVLKDDFEQKRNLITKNYISKYELQKEFSAKKLGIIPSYLMSWQVIGITDTLFNSIKGFYEAKKFDKSVQFPNRYKSTRFFQPLYFSFLKNSCTIKIINNSIVELTFQEHKKIQIICKYNTKKFNLLTLPFTKEGHKLIYNPSHKCFYFHFCIDPKLKENNSDKSIFIDLGQKNLITGYIPETNEILKVSGANLKYPKLTKRKEHIQSLLNKKKKWSRKWKHLNRTINRLQSKETNKKRTFLHKISKKLTDNFNTIVVGDLKGIKKNTQSKIKNINKYKNQFWPISLFVNMLQYKSNTFSGNRYYKINESNTTKKCNTCNHLQEMTLSDRIYNCKNCGMVLERDTNSAINIYYKFKQLEPKLLETTKIVSIDTLKTSVLKVS